jgi:hypothetical protein
MYPIVLAIHSLLRWIVLALIVALLVRTLRGWTAGRSWDRSDERLHFAAVLAIDLQLALGLVLYLALSPIAKAFLGDPGHAMHDRVLRFFGMEHLTTMLVAIVVLHVGRVLSKRVPERRHKRAFLWTLGGLVLVFVAIPWPFLKHGRPMLRSPVVEAAASGPCPPVYHARCATCHGESGHGDGIASSALAPPPRNFADPSWKREDAQIESVIRRGGAANGLSPAMPAHADLTEEETKSLVQCVRSFR